ncbi:MAG: hypothetical protein R3208_05865, partial [Ketobacteraceae bacterium]|nr:hypothetical protein [Ketobacteraceae bacterium]
MRRIDWVVSNICVLSRCALPAAFLAMLWGCGPSTTDLQSRVDELQQELEQQGRQIDALSVAYESHRGVLERLSAWEQVEFLVDNVQFQ